MSLVKRNWVPEHCENLVQSIAARTSIQSSSDIAAQIDVLAARNREIHEVECFNLNPATNVHESKGRSVDGIWYRVASVIGLSR